MRPAGAIRQAVVGAASGVSVLLLLLGASAVGAQEEASGAEALFRAAVRAEQAGEIEAALELYAQVMGEHPDTTWAELAGDRYAALGAISSAPSRLHYGVWGWVWSLLSWLCGIAFLAIVMAALGWRAGFFWSWGIASLWADRIEAFLARLGSRKSLQRELEARRTNPRDSRARYNLGVIYYNQRKYDLAAEELEGSVGIRDDRADAHYHLGLARLALGQHEQAEAALRRTVELRPDFAGRDAQLHLVEALRRLERYEEAERICREVLEKQPRSCHARWQWAQLRAAQGDEDGARTAVGETLELARVSPAAVRRRDRRLASKARRLLSNLGRPNRSN